MAGRPSRSVWEDAATEYNDDAPSVSKAAKSERWKRRTIGALAFVAVPLATLTGMSAFSAASRPLPASLDPAIASVMTNASKGKPVAYTALADWLGGTPSPLPGATVLSWDGFSVDEAPEPEADEKPITYHFEQHRFTLVRGEVLYTATVLVAVSANGAAVAVGTPSIAQTPGLPVDDSIAAWFGLVEMTAADGVREAVTSWANAYASGDPDALRREIQDRTSGRAYMPLTGAHSVASVQVIAAAYDPSVYSQNDTPDLIVVRVQIGLLWSAPVAGQNPPSPSPITYDVLVADADTATPYVVAWGGAGSGPTLTAYANAVPASKLTIPGATPNAPIVDPTDEPVTDDETEEGDD